MASLVIESSSTKNLKLLAKLAKQLGDKARIVADEPAKSSILNQEEKHIVSAFKQDNLLKAGTLKTIDAKTFLNGLD